MATYTKRKTGWLCQIRRSGHKPVSKTFKSKAEATYWGSTTESSLISGDYHTPSKITLTECIRRYIDEIVPHKKSAYKDTRRLLAISKCAFAQKPITSVTQFDIAALRDEWIAQGKTGSTVTRDLASLGHVFTVALKDWGIKLTNPVQLTRKPKPNKPRERRLNPGEESLILSACNHELKNFVIIAIETGMRRSEICGIQAKDIDGNLVTLHETKNGTKRIVPLSSKAIQAIGGMMCDGKICRHAPNWYTREFTMACKQVGIDGLRLHDLRHECLSRLAERGFNIFELKLIGGHTTTNMLSRYVNPNIKDIADRLG